MSDSPISRRHLLTFLALTAALPAEAADEIAIGPEFMTFAELAKRLSTPERPMICVDNLRERGAFIHLKKRPRAQIEELLAKGLEIEFADAGKGHRQLQRDATVVQRERLWQNQLARLLDEELTRRHSEIRAELDKIPLLTEENVKDITQQLQDRLAEFREAIAKDDKPEKERLLTRIQKLNGDLYRDKGLWQKKIVSFWTGGRNRRQLELLARQGRIKDAYPATRLVSPAQVSDLLRSWKNPTEETPPADSCVISTEVTLLRSRAYLQFELQTRLYMVDRVQYLSSANIPYKFRLPGPPSSDAPQQKPLPLMEYLFSGSVQNTPVLGPTATTYLATEKALTNDALKDPLLRQPVTLVDPPDKLSPTLPESLSEVVAGWCAATGTEAVMELYPLAGEELTREYNIYSTGDSDPEKFFVLTRPNLYDIIQRREEQWSVEKQNDVFLFRNRLAFLDRARPFPMPAFLTLIKKIPTAQRHQFPLSYAPLAAYARTARPTMEARAILSSASGPITRYQRVYLEELDGARLYVPLWEGLSESERQDAITQSTSEAGFAQIPLTRFSTALQQHIIVQAGWTERLRQQPGFQELLAQQSLRVLASRIPPEARSTIKLPESDQITHQIHLEIPHAEWAFLFYTTVVE